MKTNDVAALIRAHQNGDSERFDIVANIIMSNEFKNGRRQSGRSIRDALGAVQTVTIDSSVKPFLHAGKPLKKLHQMILCRDVLKRVNAVIMEQEKTEELKTAGLTPRHKIVLKGSPGNGKTALAGAIAQEMDIPFFVVNYSSLIASHLGETAANLSKIFDFVKNKKCVLFFDEFDTIATSRSAKDGDNTGGEMRRVVNSLLMQLESVGSSVVLIVASNLSGSFDAAIWRRFDIVLSLQKPSIGQMVKMIRSIIPSQGAIDSIFGACNHLDSFSEIEEFCKNILRTLHVNNIDLTAALEIEKDFLNENY